MVEGVEELAEVGVELAEEGFAEVARVGEVGVLRRSKSEIGE